MKNLYKSSKKGNFNNKFVKLFFSFFTIAIIGLTLYLVLFKTGLWCKVNSIDKIKSIVEQGGVFSCVIFILLQILQTTVLQIPAIIVTLAGSVIFGKWLAFILSFIAIVLGSVIMFYIGRKGGKKFLKFMIGEEKSAKLVERVSNCKYLFVLMMLFPLFPDDILCLVAGLTNMSFKFFLVTNVVARFLGVGCTIFLGTGSVIPFYGWGLLVWGVILIGVAYLFYLSIRYQDKIDETVKEIFKKKIK